MLNTQVACISGSVPETKKDTHLKRLKRSYRRGGDLGGGAQDLRSKLDVLQAEFLSSTHITVLNKSRKSLYSQFSKIR